MLSRDHLPELERSLAQAIASFRLPQLLSAQPAAIERASHEAEQLFQGFARATPPKDDAYAAALALLRGRKLTDWETELVAGALTERIRERDGARVIGYSGRDALFSRYEQDARSGNMWRMTWYALLCSYFSFDLSSANEDERTGWKELRALLERTWRYIDDDYGVGLVPDWVTTMRSEPELLTENAARRFAKAYLLGDEKPVRHLAEHLGIPQSSWFWHALVLGAVHQAEGLPDEKFKAHIPRLLALLEDRQVFRDESLEVLLTRYHGCAQADVHTELRDYVIRKDVWKNPKLKAAGIATAWNRVSAAVWQMVLNWVNERNLKDFFDILASRNVADEGRLAFWSRYLDQISWTRLIFGEETRQLARTNRAVKELIASEEGAYAILTGTRNVDAFMMQIGDYVIVEFSVKGNAAYVYPSRSLDFDRYARSYHGGTYDLRYGFHNGASVRIVHNHGWEYSAETDLKRLGIFPDDSSKAGPRAAPHVRPVREAVPPGPNATQASHRPLSVGTVPDLPTAPVALGPFPRTEGPQSVRVSAPAAAATPLGRGDGDTPVGAVFTMDGLLALVERYRGAKLYDRRSKNGGHLWVDDALQHLELGRTLQGWGFRWSRKRMSWYYPES